jgi:predicted RND superfamily exporter protein
MNVAQRYSGFVYRKPWTVLLVTAALLAPAAWAASRLDLATDFKDLLPRTRPSVVEMDRIAARIESGVSLQVAVEGNDLPGMERFADELAKRLRALPAGLVERVDESFAAERAFFDRNRWLFASYEDLEAASDALDRRVIAETPFSLDLDGHSDLDEVEQRLRKKARDWDRFPDGYYVGENGHLLAIFVTVSSTTGTDFVAARKLLDRIRAEVDAMNPAAYDRSLHVTLAGDLVTGVREYAALKADVFLSTALCVFLVLAVIVLYYGRFRSIVILGAALCVGVGWTFGFAKLAIGHLNTSTAFLGSIVAGNGINFGIVMLARYFEERRRGKATPVALDLALRRTAPGTAGAALAASIAYGSLMMTDFRGFNQFGVIGGVGMLLCWLAAYTVGPALIVLCERIPWLERRSGLRWRDPMARPFLAALRRAPRAALVVPALAVTIGSALAVRFLANDPFEYNFDHLRSKLSDADGAISVGRRTARIRDAGNDGVIVLAASHDQARKVAAAVTGDPAVGHGYTIDDLIPSRQPEKLALLDHMRGVIDKVVPSLDDGERRSVLANRPPPGLRALAAADVPLKLRSPFVEKDGTLGRIVLITPQAGHTAWDGHFLLQFANAVESTRLDDGSVVPAAGRPLIFADILRSVVTDGPRTVALSLGAVVLLVAISVRRLRPVLIVLGTLVGGLGIMLGIAAVSGIRINFLNFVAIPITIGVGADYAINLVRRQLAEPNLPAQKLVATTGGAVVLCSLTTTIGYGTLLVATNRAIASFGLLAALGEVACLTTAMLLLPSLLARVSVDRAAEAEMAPLQRSQVK